METWKTKDGKEITANRTRPNRIVCYLSDYEVEVLDVLVQLSGTSKQEYIRRSILEQEINNVDGLKELLPEMKRIGNNLNQIAKVLNTTGYYPSTLIDRNQKELAELWQQLRQSLPKQG